MTQSELSALLLKQKEFFEAGHTLPLKNRMQALQQLRELIVSNQAAIETALQQDLGKSSFESYMCEIGMTLSELTHMLKHIRQYAKYKQVRTPLAQFCASSLRAPMPYGTVLIMSPWNYPFMLTLEPWINALAAGNTAILKPSAYAPHTSTLLKNLINQNFPAELVFVIDGGRAENEALLSQRFDYIFFTGGQTVGKEVLRKAAEHLTPVTLELGGKSPCIVDETANLERAAKRIVFGKFLNCGQTCVAPDYIYCAETIKPALLAELKKQIVLQYGKTPLQNPNYGAIINDKHFHRLCGLMHSEQIAFGGKSRAEHRQLEPTLLDGVSFADPIMQEEIFGPLLPILTFQTLEEAIQTTQSLPHPLAFYYFSRSRQNIKTVLRRCQFGGGCINDTIIHLATSHMGFGGVGESGMGQYHGKAGFDTFSHSRSIVEKKNFIDLPMRYQPYTKRNRKLLHRFLK